MTYEARKSLALQHVQERLDEQHENAEYDQQEQVQQAIDDREETARQSGVHPMMRSESPGKLRALAHAREWAAEHRPAMTDAEQLVDSPFGNSRDDDDGRDDEDDYLE